MTEPKPLRPFRVSAYIVYLVVVGTFVVLVSTSVIRSVHAMSPGPQPAAVPESVAACRMRATLLWQELEGQRRSFTALPEAKGAGQRWTDFRTSWMERFREAEAHCARGESAPPELRRLFSELERVQQLYATHANQYAAEVGGAVDRFRKTLGGL